MEPLDFIWNVEDPKPYLDLYKKALLAERKIYQRRMIGLLMVIQSDSLDMYQDEILEIEKTLEKLDAFINLYYKNK